MPSTDAILKSVDVWVLGRLEEERKYEEALLAEDRKIAADKAATSEVRKKQGEAVAACKASIEGGDLAAAKAALKIVREHGVAAADP